MVNKTNSNSNSTIGRTVWDVIFLNRKLILVICLTLLIIIGIMAILGLIEAGYENGFYFKIGKSEAKNNEKRMDEIAAQVSSFENDIQKKDQRIQELQVKVTRLESDLSACKSENKSLYTLKTFKPETQATPQKNELSEKIKAKTNFPIGDIFFHDGAKDELLAVYDASVYGGRGNNFDGTRIIEQCNLGRRIKFTSILKIDIYDLSDKEKQEKPKDCNRNRKAQVIYSDGVTETLYIYAQVLYYEGKRYGQGNFNAVKSIVLTNKINEPRR